eukprot:TRINITY_DN899_c0_g1_i10.p1 TRINITY_DN899_c0_g1~~TRINITY_DN899_c0_g1_i10.p1  ORF type:complete len:201 (-),score=61.85 TRINITY_DN899_c0_g1_i10:139-741(-)
MFRKCCPWLFPAKEEAPAQPEDQQGLLTEDRQAAPGGKGLQVDNDVGTTPAGTGAVSEYEEEMEQLSNIVALMLAEAIFAYETPFEIKLEQQFAMMFDMQLSFSFDSLKEAEKQLMNALAEIFENKPASDWFFSQLNAQMVGYVDGLTQPQKWEYKSKSGYGRPDKLEVVLEGEDAPGRSAEDTVTVSYTHLTLPTKRIV